MALARVSVEPEGLATFVGDDVVRVYHLGSGAYVRDPRTGQRSAHPREVLNGTIDAFLLAYLEQAGAEG